MLVQSQYYDYYNLTGLSVWKHLSHIAIHSQPHGQLPQQPDALGTDPGAVPQRASRIHIPHAQLVHTNATPARLAGQRMSATLLCGQVQASHQPGLDIR